MRLERELSLLRKRNERLVHEKAAADKRVSEVLSGGAAGASVLAGEMSTMQERARYTQEQLMEMTEKYNRLLSDGGGRSVARCVSACESNTGSSPRCQATGSSLMFIGRFFFFRICSNAKEREYLEQINKLLIDKNALTGSNTQWERDVKFLTDELNELREKYSQMQEVYLGGNNTVARARCSRLVSS